MDMHDRIEALLGDQRPDIGTIEWPAEVAGDRRHGWVVSRDGMTDVEASMKVLATMHAQTTSFKFRFGLDTPKGGKGFVPFVDIEG